MPNYHSLALSSVFGFGSSIGLQFSPFLTEAGFFPYSEGKMGLSWGDHEFQNTSIPTWSYMHCSLSSLSFLEGSFTYWPMILEATAILANIYIEQLIIFMCL